MPAVPKILKGPSASFSHNVDYTGWSMIGDETDTISSATASATPSGLTLGSVGVNTAGTQVSIPLSGGTLGVTYNVTVLATTSAGDVLDAYFDVFIGTGIAGAVLAPSQFGPYVDRKRSMELLYDDGELDDDEAVPAWATVDGNETAFMLAQAAWRDILEAARRGEVYSLQELTDYANDLVRGADLIKLAAGLFWGSLIERRRYTKGEPQGEDPAYEKAQRRLQELRLGERIFDLEGVANSSGGSYTNELGVASAISVGTFGATDQCKTARRLWGCDAADGGCSTTWPRRYC